MKKILLYLDKTRPQDLSLLAASKMLVKDEACVISAIGYKEDLPLGNSVYDEVMIIDDQHVMAYDTMNLTALLKQIQHDHHFDIILFPSTPLGRILAPRLAIALHVGLVADVTGIDAHDGIVELIRPAYSGKLMAKILIKGEGPLMMTLRPNIFTYHTEDLKQTVYHQVKKHEPKASGIILLETKQKVAGKDIRDCKVLISGGGGVLHQFKRLEDLACVLHAEVSASRRVVDSGVAHRKIQVGQSGKTVSPKLYIALGISGSVQHIEGLKNVETIIAVNTNKNAPICSLATLVVEGDAIEFIEKLLSKIKENNLNFKEETQ